jgi:hypothetical protein
MSAHKTLSATLFAVLLVFAGVCEGPPEALADPAAPAEAEAAVATSPVKNIVFIGKEKACDCTKERVDASRAILTRVLEAAPIPVKTLHVDKEDERAEVDRYLEMKAFMVLPAIFLLDGEGGLVELLQGEVTEKQVREALAPRG